MKRGVIFDLYFYVMVALSLRVASLYLELRQDYFCVMSAEIISIAE